MINELWDQFYEKIGEHEKKLRSKYSDSKLDKWEIEKRIRNSINRKFRKENLEITLTHYNIVAQLKTS